MVEEADRVALAHRSFGRTNAYFTQDRDDLPESHPRAGFTTGPTPSSLPTISARTACRDLRLAAFADFIRTALRQQAFFPTPTRSPT